MSKATSQQVRPDASPAPMDTHTTGGQQNDTLTAERAAAGRDLILACVMSVASIGYLLESTRIHVPSRQSDGMTAQTYPQWLGIILLALSLCLGGVRLVQWQRARRQGAGATATVRAGAMAMARPTLAVLGAGVSLWAMPRVGFLIATPLLVTLLIVLADADGHYRGRRLLVPLILGVVVASATHFVFDGLLGVLLPPGVLDPSWGL